MQLDGPREGEVLVEIKATGLCHTDKFTLSGAVWAKRRRQASSSSLRRVAISSFHMVNQISGAARPWSVTRLSANVDWSS